MNLCRVMVLGGVFGASFLSSWRTKPMYIEPRAYVLGAVKDYMGRSRIRVAGKIEMPDKIDEFHDTEQPLLDYIVRLLKTSEYSCTVTRRYQENCGNCHEFQVLKSEKLAEEINNCYSFRFFSKGWDEQERVEKVYRGWLTRPHLITKESKMAFLAGAYARYGHHQDNTYTIRLGNSFSKYNLIIIQLKILQCRIEAEKIINGVPTAQVVEFVPTEELRAYLDEQNVLIDSVAVRRDRTK